MDFIYHGVVYQTLIRKLGNEMKTEKINQLKQDINMIISEFEYHNNKLEKKLKEIKLFINKIK